MTQNSPEGYKPPTRIGFIGLGNMGYPMAVRLANAGYELTVSDLNTDIVQKFCAETGSNPASNLGELGTNSQVVITMLPEGKAVRSVLLGEGGVISTLPAGATLLDMSSCSPVGTRELTKELAELGYPMVDAPVSGGISKAANGSLAVMAGGEASAVEICLPILQVLGKPFKTGGPASGHAMKAMNNFLSAGTLALTAEAIILGGKFGLEQTTMIDILNVSTGRSNSSEDKFPKFVLPRTFNSGFFLGLMAKDLRFAKDLADSEQTPTELLRVITSMWDKAEDQMGFNADNTDIYRYLESLVEDQSA